MEEEYNWGIILKIAIPISLIEAYIFYANINDIWKWLSLIAGLALAGFIIYSKDKKRSTVFTALGIILLVVLVVRFLKKFGFF